MERRGPAVCSVSDNMEGKDEMTKPSIELQDLRRRLYVKAKAETSWRFWGLYVHVCKLETLQAAYALAERNDGAPGSDGVTFAAIEAQGVAAFLAQIRDELVGRTCDPGSGGAGCAQADIGADLRGRLPTGLVWISSQADSS